VFVNIHPSCIASYYQQFRGLFRNQSIHSSV
jgi:hypothetical protein